MKKFVTTLLIGIATVVCAFAFTSCGKEVKTTVTEEEWKEAISALTEGKTSFKGEWNYEYKGEDGEEEVLYIVELDTANKSCHFYYTYEEDGEKLEYSNYYWIDAEDNAYSAEFIPNNEGIEKRACDKDEYDEIVEMYVGECAGVDILAQGDLADKYGEFEYDESQKAYVATLELFDESVELVLKFENGKLVYFFAKPAEEEGKITYTFTYSYGVKVTVPQDILDMPVEED